MRRKHCEITDRREMADILAATNIGRMATIDADGYPYIVPLNFVFHQDKIYFHCSHKGEKIDNIARDDRVCFEVDVPLAYLEMAFNRKNNPCEVHQFYRSVIIRGRARVVPDGELKAQALTALLVKHEGRSDVPAVLPDNPDAKACAVVEVTPERMTGKEDLAQNKDQEGARRQVASCLVRRGLSGDLEAVALMGYDIEYDGRGGRCLK